MHLFVLYGYQGADTDAEQLALTDQLFDAALGEVSILARGQALLLVGDFNGSPPRSFAWQKGFRLGSGLTLRLPGLWLVVDSQPATCKREWSSSGGHRCDFMVGCPLAAAAVLSCRFQQ